MQIFFVSLRGTALVSLRDVVSRLETRKITLRRRISTSLLFLPHTDVSDVILEWHSNSNSHMARSPASSP